MKRVFIPLISWLSLACLIAGVLLPMLIVKNLWIFTHSVSILAALIKLLQQQEIFIFLIVFVFSVLFPFFKIVFMLFTWHFSHRNLDRYRKYLHVLSVLGKWSMLDVFVIALLVLIIRFGSIANAQISWGFYSFVVSVVLSIIASSMMVSYKEKEK